MDIIFKKIMEVNNHILYNIKLIFLSLSWCTPFIWLQSNFGKLLCTHPGRFLKGERVGEWSGGCWGGESCDYPHYKTKIMLGNHYYVDWRQPKTRHLIRVKIRFCKILCKQWGIKKLAWDSIIWFLTFS